MGTGCSGYIAGSGQALHREVAVARTLWFAFVSGQPDGRELQSARYYSTSVTRTFTPFTLAPFRRSFNSSACLRGTAT